MFRWVLACFAGLQGFSALGQEAVFSQPYWTQSPVVEAMGRAQVEVEANRARLSVSFVRTDREADNARDDVVTRARAAYQAIKAITGAKARVQTSVSVYPYYEQYRDKDGNVYENERPDKVSGYEATATVDIILLEPSLAGRARGAALALAPERSDGPYYYLERTSEMDRTAFVKAVEDAAARAKESARAAGAPLGRLLVLQEGDGPCLGRWTSPDAGRSAPSEYRAYATPKAALDTVTVSGTRKSVTITEDDVARLDLPSDAAPLTVTAQVCAVYAVGP